MLRALLFLGLLIYPLAVYLSLETLGPAVLAAVLAGLLVLRLAVTGQLSSPRRIGLTIGALALFLLLATVSGDERVLKAYPVLINLALLGLFAWSLRYPPTMPERAMRLAGQSVPPEAKHYLWWVTLAWCGFFLLNGLVAAWTALQASLAWWALYNGLLSYLLIGLFFALEFAVRSVVKRRHAARGRGLDPHG